MLRTWIIYAAAMLATTYVIPDFRVKSVWDAIVVAAVFGVLNFFIGWAIKAFIIVGTLGIGLLLMFITRWVSNAILLEMTTLFTGRVQIKGFGTALAASAVMSLAGTLIEWLLTKA